jgi:hypothetical protein
MRFTSVHLNRCSYPFQNNLHDAQADRTMPKYEPSIVAIYEAARRPDTVISSSVVILVSHI